MKKLFEHNISIVVLLGCLMPILLPVSGAHAQCTPLQSHVCQPETSYPHDYSFNQLNNYWTVVGVIPTNPDDKDIYLYPACGSGTLLAASGGTDGIDFIVGDFNHNPVGTYYPRATYGNASAFYNVYWRSGTSVFPVSEATYGQIGGSGSGCEMIHVFDVKLEADHEYRISLDPAFGLWSHVSLFRNPSTGTFWGSRYNSELELVAGEPPAYYVAPATDWYGLVVFPIWNQTSSEPYLVDVERLGDCIEMEPDVCTTKKLYSTAEGPANDYLFIQGLNYWSVVAVVPDTLDDKGLHLFSECDENGAYLANSVAEGTGDTELIMADFNHTPSGAYFPMVNGGNVDAEFSISWDSGGEIFPVPGEITGMMSGTEGGCTDVRVWDVYLEAGVEYEFFFYEYGQKDPHLALFRNPGAGDYIVGRISSEFEMSGSGYQNYTAPQTDWYGLVVFANERKPHSSLYQVRVEPLNDCVPLSSSECVWSQSWPGDFSFDQTIAYWAAVAVCPDQSDYKGLSVYTQCDGKGSLLAYSAGGRTSLVVSDFNTGTAGTYYPRVVTNSLDAPWKIAMDNDQEVLHVGEFASGVLGRDPVECGLVRIWDVFLESGITYQIGFTQSGDANIHLALFRNPGSGDYWAPLSQAEWELVESQNYSYPAPATDWYGIVVFANKYDEPGSYTVAISEEGATGIEPIVTGPEEFALYQNAPNPFNPSTVIRYDVPAGGGQVTLAVYDVNGRLVRTLRSGVETAGEKSVTWDARDNNGVRVASGVYFYRLVAPGFDETHKMVVTK